MFLFCLPLLARLVCFAWNKDDETVDYFVVVIVNQLFTCILS